MKNRIVSLILFLCTVFSLLALSACGPKRPVTNPTTSDTATAATTDKWEVLAPKVKQIDEADRQLKIELSTKVTAEKASKNGPYVMGPDALDSSIPEVQRMVYERNEKAKERLGVTVEYISNWDLGYGKQTAKINDVVAANAADAPDLFINMIYDMNMSLINGCFKDVWSLPSSFFDFEAPGWMDNWMKNMSFTGDRAYILASDYFMDVFCSMSLLPFNMTMMDANASKLTEAILGTGETLKTGEKLSNFFFDFVEDGNWTWDVLGELCEAIWVDKGTVGQDDIYDTLGIIADRFGGINAASFLYSCGETLVESYEIKDPTNPYNNKQWLKYPETPASLNLIFDKVKAVFEGNGSLATSYTFSGNTPEAPGSAYHHTKFAKGELLFAGVCLLGTLEDDSFRQMTDVYSVVPCPKADASKEYNTIIVNQADAGAINVHTSRNKARALSAFLQYCTEHSADIREELLGDVMKYEITTYNLGTDRMLDIIYEGILYGRDKTVDDLICMGDDLRGERWHSLLKDDDFEGGSSYFTTSYQSLRDAKQARLDEYMATWYTLPKVEN